VTKFGARKTVQMKVRLYTKIAWQVHFFKNMFLRPSGSHPEGETAGSNFGHVVRLFFGLSGTGKIENTRMASADYHKLAPFNLMVPKKFNPRDTWMDKVAYEREAKKLAGLFDQNFKRFEK